MKTELDYVKDINAQLEKTIPEQLEDLKLAVAQLCVALDKLSREDNINQCIEPFIPTFHD